MPPDGSLAHHTTEKPRQSRLVKARKQTTPSPIVEAALRIKTLVDRENYLDDKRGSLTPEEKAEDDRIYNARMALAEQITLSEPRSGTEALIVVMHAVDRLNFGSAINEGGDIIDTCERAIRTACVVLAREMAVNLVPFGSENFLPDHLRYPPDHVNQHSAVVDGDDQEICLMLHRLWWQARQKRLARDLRVETPEGRAWR